MIRKIRIKFIAVAMAALFVLLAVTVIGINVINYNTILWEADKKLEMLSQNNGRFPEFTPGNPWPIPSGMTQETPYEVRYFSILLTESGEILRTDTLRIKAIDANAAADYALKALQSRKTQAFIQNYRFILCREGSAVRITFLDCSRELSSFRRFLTVSLGMAVLGYSTFFFVILFFSSRITKPVAESYEKQKQFITDAGHEIKTPLAIIKADVDVLEMEYGENEWLDGIQAQVKRLADLTNDLVYLSRMEESESNLQMIDFPFSDVVSETAQAFHAVAQSGGKTFLCSIEPMLSLTGNEKSIRQLINILMDNAMKYSPEAGHVALTVQKQGRFIMLCVYNTTADPIEKQHLSHVFERFYRMDSSRNSRTGGYGIGLSVAKAIVTAHGGKICAVTPDEHSLQINVHLPL